MPSFFSRLKSSSTKSGKDRPSSSSSKPPTTTTTSGGGGAFLGRTPTNLLELQLPSTSLLADASRTNPHFLSTPDRQLSFSSAHEGTRGGGLGGESDLRSLRSATDADADADEEEASRWVSVSGDNSTPRTIRTTSKVGRGTGVRFPDLAAAVAEGSPDPQRERREQARLERARLSIEDVTLLSEECGDVIRSRGLTTLGLFRPYRASESPSQFRKLALLFLDYVAEFDERTAAAATAVGNDASPSRGTDASKAVLLHAYRQELRFANVHDVVAVLKWGLRHLDFGRTTFSASRAPSLDWYTSFVRRSSVSTSSSPPHPRHAFSQYLLPSFPPPSQRLLLSLLHTIQPVAAHAQQNAMPAQRLCYLLGAYIFGLATPPSPSSATGANRIDWDEYSRTWSEAGRALEGCLKAYLREQTDLPPRLQELIDDYPTWIAEGDNAHRRRRIKALKVEIESIGEWELAGAVRSNSQSTGLGVASKTARPVRRRPVEILQAAIEAEPSIGGADSSDEEERAWNALARLMRVAGKNGGKPAVLAPLDEETVRVLELLELARAASTDAEVEGTPNKHRRTRSSVDPTDLSPFHGSSMRSSLSPSPSTPAISPRAKLRASPSWQDFSMQGFTQSSLDLSSDLYDPSKNRMMPKPQAEKVAPPTSRIVSVSIVDVDEDFVAVWLDSLSESNTTSSPVAGWPSILLTPLSPSARSEDGLSAAGVAALLIVESLLPRQRPALATLDLPPRSAGLQPPLPQATTERRASFLGVRRGRKSEGAPPSSNSPPVSPSKNWRRRASALFAPPLTSRHPSSEETSPSSPLSRPSNGGGTVSLDSSPRAQSTRPCTLPLHAGTASRVPSGPPVDVFGTAIPLPSAPMVPEKSTLAEGNSTAPQAEEVEGYTVDEPDLETPQESVADLVKEAAAADDGAALETPEEPAPVRNEHLNVESPTNEPAAVLESASPPEDGPQSKPETERVSEPAVEQPAMHPADDAVAEPIAETVLPLREELADANAGASGSDQSAPVDRMSPDSHAEREVLEDPAPVSEELPDDALEPLVQGKLAQETGDSAGGAPRHSTAEGEKTVEAGTAFPLPFLAPAIPLSRSEAQLEQSNSMCEASDSLASNNVGAALDPSPLTKVDNEAATATALASPPVRVENDVPASPSPRRKVPSPISTPRRSFDSSTPSSPPLRSPRHPARSPSSPIRRNSTPGMRASLHKTSSSSLEAEEIKQLRKVEEEAKRKAVKEQKTPKPVSNVKARVREIEEEAISSPRTIAAAVALPTSPIRATSPVQRPITPRRSSQRLPSPSPARGIRPILAPAIIAGSPTPLARAVVPTSNGSEVPAGADDGSVDTQEIAGARASPYSNGKLTSEGVYPAAELHTLAQPDFASVHNSDGGAPAESTALSATPPTRLPPTQESHHLHVKVPTSLADLPSPIPSPSPVVIAAEKEAAAPLLSEDATIQPSELAPLSFEPASSLPETSSPSGADESIPGLDPPHVSPGQFAAVSVMPEAPPVERPSTPTRTSALNHNSAYEEETTTPLAPATALGAAGQPEQPPHVLHVSPSKQSLATDTSYQTAVSQTTSLAGSSDPGSVA
ncbi:hypothetical protein JCM10908_007390 [Rhodotorula pacifica]|uniref:uncharacterized protein n=1 Tax=Rhodotorula pacifica TaxID=1495444 RepID=UPI003172ACB2